MPTSLIPPPLGEQTCRFENQMLTLLAVRLAGHGVDAGGGRGSLKQLVAGRQACWPALCPGLESRGGAAALWLGAYDTGSRIQGCYPRWTAGSESNMVSTRAGAAV